MLEVAAGLPGKADLVDGEHIGLQVAQFLDNQRPPIVPPFVVLFQIQCRYSKSHASFYVSDYSTCLNPKPRFFRVVFAPQYALFGQHFHFPTNRENLPL